MININIFADHVFSDRTKLKKIFYCALILRVIWFFTPGYAGDFDSFENWAVKMVEHGTTAAYSFQDINYDCDYPPVYLYILSFFGHIFHWLDLPIDSLLFDNVLRCVNLVVEFVFIFFIHHKFKNNLLTLLLLFSPVAIINAYAWGQVDILYAIILFMVFFSIYEKKLNRAALYLATGLAFKTHVFLFLPVIGLYFLFSENKASDKIRSFIFCLCFFILLNLPFMIWAEDTWSSLNANFSAAGRYPYISMFAFNSWWAIFADKIQMFPPEDVMVWNMLSRRTLAFIISGILLCITVLPLFKKISFQKLSIVVCLFSFTYFMFLPEIHERYLFPFFLFSAFVVSVDHSEWKYYLALSVIHVFNLFWAWIFIWKLPHFYMFEISIALSYLSVIIWICYYIARIKKLSADSH